MATRAERTKGRKDGKTESPVLPPSVLPSFRPSAYRGVFPNSRKVYLEGPRGVRVPMREIPLSDAEPPLRVYDTSGPEGFDVQEGLPGVRAEWIRGREVEETERRKDGKTEGGRQGGPSALPSFRPSVLRARRTDRKSTRLNSSHG